MADYTQFEIINDAPCKGCTKLGYCGIKFPQWCKEFRDYCYSIDPSMANDQFVQNIPLIDKP